MTLTYDLYWSFRSPYSYLITHKLVELERDYDVRGAIRPVYPLAVRTPELISNPCPSGPRQLTRSPCFIESSCAVPEPTAFKTISIRSPSTRYTENGRRSKGPGDQPMFTN